MKNKEDFKTFLAGLLPFAQVQEGKQFTEVVVPAEKWHETAEKLRNNETAPFDYLISFTAVDYLSRLTVVYHLESVSTRDFVVVKTNVEDRESPQLDTVSDVWVTAEFHEREVFDLFGIRFNGHPDLRRLFLEEDYGFPLRKDFKDEVNIIQLPN